MPHGRKNNEGKARDLVPLAGSRENNLTFGEALSKAGFDPAKFGRKIVSQGKRRETLKKRTSKDPDK